MLESTGICQLEISLAVSVYALQEEFKNSSCEVEVVGVN